MLLKTIPFTKWSHVFCRNSCSTLPTICTCTSDKVRQVIGQTLVCVSIYLECWLDKARVEIVPWAVVGVARQQQFSYNSVVKSGSVSATNVDSIRIRCVFGECEFNSHSNRIQCEKTLSVPQVGRYT